MATAGGPFGVLRSGDRLPWKMIRSIWQFVDPSCRSPRRGHADRPGWRRWRGGRGGLGGRRPTAHHPLDGVQVGSRRDGADGRAGGRAAERDQTAFHDHVAADHVGHRNLVGRRVGVLQRGIDVPRGDLAVEMSEDHARDLNAAVKTSAPAEMASGADWPQLSPEPSTSSTTYVPGGTPVSPPFQPAVQP